MQSHYNSLWQGGLKKNCSLIIALCQSVVLANCFWEQAHLCYRIASHSGSGGFHTLLLRAAIALHRIMARGRLNYELLGAGPSMLSHCMVLFHGVLSYNPFWEQAPESSPVSAIALRDGKGWL